MKNKSRHKLICILLLCFVMFSFTIRGFADFGSYSGDSDYSSSDWSSDSGSSYDSGWSSSGSDYGYYGGSGSSGSDSDFDIFTVIIFVIILIYVFTQFRGMNKIHANKPVNTAVNRVTRGQPVEQYKSIDPGFDSAEFAAKLSNVYVKLQNAWQAKDLTEVRPYLTDDFYAQMERQLNIIKSKHQTNYIERIAVLSVEPKTFYQDNELDHIVAYVKTRIVDYTLDDNTGALISGDKTREKFMTYEYDLCRKKGVITKISTGMKSVVCPHCGAPLNINQTAKCPYCDSIVTIENEDWAIKSIKGISQQTV
ncbi:Tim44 domain-containing protein [Oribacterium sp. WCC10]|uniref:Tim44 domain-containing protein n=1 Tax=Oribacterium sp. WCC10 TaxID=1855343 RepID=UPI0008F406D6|nr:Tim44-like domain-containing protein [Oribacterium sp. WCC10]SFG42629.1 Tim44-like domain-containing protein [Oribacterium sp. WCC10]